MNTTKKGEKLEIYVEQLFRDYWKLFVRRNVQYYSKSILTGKQKKAQIDLEYWSLFGRTIVECKYYSGGKVGVSEIEEFYQRGKKVPHYKAVMVTNKEYTSPAVELAKRYRIKLIDGSQLGKFDDGRRNLLEMIADLVRKRKWLEEKLRGVETESVHEYSISRIYRL